MKVTFTMDEVRSIIREAAEQQVVGTSRIPDTASVRFVHRYHDGSGEGEVDAITPVNRVEIEFEFRRREA